MNELTDDTFAHWRMDVLDLPEKVIAYFTAPWCGPCRMLKPRLEELERENLDLTVVRIDVSLNPELARQFNIQSVPTLMFFQAGYQQDIVHGIKPKAFLQEILDSLPIREIR